MTSAAYRVALENSYLGTWAVLPVTLSLLLLAVTAGARSAGRRLSPSQSPAPADTAT